MKMLNKEFRKIFDKVQKNSANHQKYVQVLIDVYKKTDSEKFIKTFLEFLQIVFRQNIDNNPYVKRLLNFTSQFAAEITRKEERETETHDFLTQIILKVVEWSTLSCHEIRYNSCRFISLVLQSMGDTIQLEMFLIDEIQAAMLERMRDTKISIRLKAITALVHLQDPENDCPVINAYIEALSSSTGCIRREVTANIAPNLITLSKIKDRIRDVDASVRSAAFHRCADIGPMNFKISEKHMILLCGFKEKNDNTKKTFFDYLLPKWLTAYNGNFLNFIKALKIMADEEDAIRMVELSNYTIKWFYNNYPINELMAVLPLNDEKLIEVKDLTNEITLFWNILTSLLRESDMDEDLDNVIPELTSFGHYLDRVIKEKSREDMDEWKYFEYQFDLLNLFEIAEKYDFADEVGRRTMQSLTTTVLQKFNFTSIKLIKKIVSIAHQCYTNIDFFTNDMCQVISEIREPLVEEPMSQDQQKEQLFKISQMNMKINILKEQQEDAVAKRDYQTAQVVYNELNECTKQLEKLQSRTDTEKVRVAKSDNETLCRCLDILISVLELPEITKLTPSLITCKQNFLIPLITHSGVEAHWRVLKCLSLMALVNKATAEEYGKIICIPIATYRTVPVNTSSLIQSICGIVDLISLYGIEMISDEESTTSVPESNITTNHNSTKRKLYSNENEENLTNTKQDSITFSYIFEIFLDMLDDEREEIRCKAVLAVASLIKRSFSVTPSVISRLILKWYSPLTEKYDARLRVRLGLLLENFTSRKECKEILKEAIIPTLSTIANAPRTSPLADIDVDNVMLFFAQILNLMESKDNLRILSLDICMKISENLKNRVAPFLVKFLSHLDLECDNRELFRELIDKAEMLLENIREKGVKKNMERYVSALKDLHLKANTDLTQQSNETVEKSTNCEQSEIHDKSSKEQNEIVENGINHEYEQSCNVPETILKNTPNHMEKTQQIKRRKRRCLKECVVVLEKLGEKSVNDTTLHTILETSMEQMQLDDDLTIETPTTGSNNSKNSSFTRNNTVISETSDSDFSNDNGVMHRRSTRCRKKRIL